LYDLLNNGYDLDALEEVVEEEVNEDTSILTYLLGTCIYEGEVLITVVVALAWVIYL